MPAFLFYVVTARKLGGHLTGCLPPGFHVFCRALEAPWWCVLLPKYLWLGVVFILNLAGDTVRFDVSGLTTYMKNHLFLWGKSYHIDKPCAVMVALWHFFFCWLMLLECCDRTVSILVVLRWGEAHLVTDCTTKTNSCAHWSGWCSAFIFPSVRVLDLIPSLISVWKKQIPTAQGRVGRNIFWTCSESFYFHWVWVALGTRWCKDLSVKISCWKIGAVRYRLNIQNRNWLVALLYSKVQSGCCKSLCLWI